MNSRVPAIVALADAGTPASAIAAALDITVGRVYAVLREQRPGRKRKSRRHTSVVPDQVRGLVSGGIKPARVAVLLSITPAYVYRIIGGVK